uniref:OSJNBb0060E08.7 protein n=1 Tax=Oryza sativa subsp. japonica TaxID=39947 RepID=Q7XM92_ORYSJ|nr:OSJNBb0060E08.7 [Oryza sativa Japonica Group]
MARPKRTKPPPPSRKAETAAAAAQRPSSSSSSPSPSLPEALLLATVCMVGLPVEVQVRDGSAYAGVLHTASVEGAYGVVLKKARKIANGNDNANIPLGAFVDSLVIHPDDLVQVIAKDFSLHTKDVCRTPVCDTVAASAYVKPQTSHVNVFPLKEVKKCSTPGEETNISIGRSSPDVKISPPATVAKTATPSKTIAKESKLNPCARVFSPSFASSRPVLAAAPSVNPIYISNSVAGVPTGLPVFETNSVPGGSSLSSKAVHYNNLAAANYAISPQYTQSTMGHNVSRLDPARIGTPYHPMQVGPAYISPSPQPVTGGKFNHVVYVHPFSQDVMHGAPVMPQGWSLPAPLKSHQASLQKFQGLMYIDLVNCSHIMTDNPAMN